MDTIDRIFDLMNKEKVTKAFVSKETTIKKPIFTQWEKRKQKPSAEALVKLSKYFKVSTDYLLEQTNILTTPDRMYEIIKSIAAEQKLDISQLEKEIKLSDDSPKAEKEQEVVGKTATAKQPIKEVKQPIHPYNEFIPQRLSYIKIVGNVAAGYNGIAEEEQLGEIDVLPASLRGYPVNECFVLRVNGASMYPDFQDGDLVLVHRETSVDSGSIAVILYGDDDEATLKRVEYKQNGKWVKLVPINEEYETKIIKGDDLQYCHVLGRVVSIIERKI